MQDGRYVVGPVMKALRVLDLVTESSSGAHLATLAPRLGLPKTTVFRYLCSLVAAGYLEHDPLQDLYLIGTRFRALDAAGDDTARLRDAALPVLTELRDRFNETINLGMLRGRHVAYVDILECRHRLRMQARVGGRDPVHSTALGKAILARLSDADRRKLLSPRLPPRTSRTQTERPSLEAELDTIRRRGWAVEQGENEAGAICIGVALVLPGLSATAAISLSAPDARMSEERIDSAGKALLAAGRRIAVRLDAGDPTQA